MATLYLFPTGLSDAPIDTVLPALNQELMKRIRHYVVENVREARRFLRRVSRDIDINSLSFRELNEHTPTGEGPSYLEPLRRGEDLGLMSDAGCPGVADPGAEVVAAAQREGYRVVPLVGPSSMLLSLMASGFNGQGYAFNGYLPIEKGARAKRLRELEQRAVKEGMTQIFIETPYRNGAMMDALCETLHPTTLVCVASGITDPEKEYIKTKSIADWKRQKPELGKTPTVYLIGK